MPQDGAPESGHGQADISPLPNGALLFGAALKVALGRRGYTQASLAQAIDVDPMQVYRWIRGYATPRPHACARLLVALGGAESPLWSDPALQVLARRLGVVRQDPDGTNGDPSGNGHSPAPAVEESANDSNDPVRETAPTAPRRRTPVLAASAAGFLLVAVLAFVFRPERGSHSSTNALPPGDPPGSTATPPHDSPAAGAPAASEHGIGSIIPVDGAPWVLVLTSGRKLSIPMTTHHGHFSWNTGKRVREYTRIGKYLSGEDQLAVVVSLDTEIPNHPSGEIRIDYFNAAGYLRTMFLTEAPTYGDQVFAPTEWSLETLRFMDWNADRIEDILVVATHTGFPSFLTAVCDGKRQATYFNAGHIKGLIALPGTVYAGPHPQPRTASVVSPVGSPTPRPPALALCVEFNDAPRCAGLVVLPPLFESGAYPADDPQYRYKGLKALGDAYYMRILPSLIAQRFKAKQNWPGNIEPWDAAGESFRMTTLETPDERGVMRRFGAGIAMNQVAFTDAFRNDVDWEPKTPAARQALAASLETVAVRRNGKWVKVRYDKSWIEP